MINDGEKEGIQGNIEINDNPVKVVGLVEEKPILISEKITENKETLQKSKNEENDNNFSVSVVNTSDSAMNLENQNGLFNSTINNKKLNEENLKEIEYMTLEETVCESLKRDLFRIYSKLKHVITPRMSSKKIEELYNWDLWGPLIFCFLLSIALSSGKNSKNESSIFVIIFTIFWLGGLIVTLNGKFLGAKIGICQMICLLGYCMFPITVGGMIIGFVEIKNAVIRVIIVMISFIWACLASNGFISALIDKEKQLIAVIPVILFFLSLSLFVLNY